MSALQITKKALDNMQASVSKRLTPDLVSAYTANFPSAGDDPMDDGRAARVHTDLRDVSQKFVALGALVACLQASGGNEASAGQLRAASDGCKACDITLSSHVERTILTRVLSQAVRTTDFEKCVRVLDPAPQEDTVAQHLFSYKDLGDEEVAALQRRVLTEEICLLAKTEPDRAKGADCTRVSSALRSLRALARALPLDREAPRYIRDEELHGQLRKLALVLAVPEMTDEAHFKAAESAREQLMNDSCAMFHRLVSVFYTGVQARVEADAILDKVKADAGLTLVLNGLKKAMAKCSPPRVDECLVMSGGKPV